MWLALRILFRRLFKNGKPILVFVSPGIDDLGRVELEMDWNNAFVKHIRDQGFIGHNEEECVQMFLMSFTAPAETEEGMTPINSDSHPYLNKDTGNLVKR